MVCSTASAIHQDWSRPLSAVRGLWTVVLAALVAYATLRPLLGLGHELSVCAVAALLHAVVGTGFWQPIISWLGLDPIYAGAAIRAAGGVQVDGLAVAGPLGGWLHALLPRVIMSPDAVAAEAGISMVAAPGAPALGRGLSGFGADVLWLVVGLRLTWRWPKSVRRWECSACLSRPRSCQPPAGRELSIPDLEASGLPLALAIAAPNDTPWFSRDLRAAAGLRAHAGRGCQSRGARVPVCGRGADGHCQTLAARSAVAQAPAQRAARWPPQVGCGLAP